MECHLKYSPTLYESSVPLTSFFINRFISVLSVYIYLLLHQKRTSQQKNGRKKFKQKPKKETLKKKQNISQKQQQKPLPISFLLTVLTATISLKVLGTPSCRQEIYRHAAAIASLDLPFRFFPSCTILNRLLALSTIVLVRFILSAMLEIVLQNLNTLSVSYWQNKGTLESVWRRE